jgi:hypothetical protein
VQDPGVERELRNLVEPKVGAVAQVVERTGHGAFR